MSWRRARNLRTVLAADLYRHGRSRYPPRPGRDSYHARRHSKKPRRDARVAEGAPLLREYRVKSSIEGSNPSLSATYAKRPLVGRFAYVAEREEGQERSSSQKTTVRRIRRERIRTAEAQDEPGNPTIAPTSATKPRRLRQSFVRAPERAITAIEPSTCATAMHDVAPRKSPSQVCCRKRLTRATAIRIIARFPVLVPADCGVLYSAAVQRRRNRLQRARSSVG